MTDDDWRSLGLMTPAQWDRFREGITRFIELRRSFGKPVAKAKPPSSPQYDEEDGGMAFRE